MRLIKIGNVYNAKCFIDDVEFIDSECFWHFKIIEIVYTDGKPIKFLGIKMGMKNYDSCLDGDVWAFELDGNTKQCIAGCHYSLGRRLPTKDGKPITL